MCGLPREAPDLQSAAATMRPALLRRSRRKSWGIPRCSGWMAVSYTHLDVYKRQTLNSIRSYFLTWEKRGVPQAWVMVHKHDDKVIGNLDIHTIDGDIGEIGYLMHPDYWNQGLMREAVSALVKAGFAHVGLRRMEAYVAVEHPASAAVLKHCGFVQEGILRKLALLSDGRYHDMVLMSILKEDILTESFRLDK